ncbi:hypothetical protein R75461_08022 [Paraburkholderia nemoris]|nr:hypothetical protein R75461_08022 [Paraburkholderia nemoris]
MEIICRPIDTLIPYARNARTHSGEQVAQIAASLDEFGMAGAIVVRDGIIAKGHGRLAAIRKLHAAGKKLYPAPGRTHGAQPFADGEVPVLDATGWTDAQFRAFVIADNRLAEQAAWDDDLLRVELGDLQEDGFDLDITGFNADELDALLALPADALARAHVTLAERFMVPSFSVLNAREGWWQTRKQAWITLGLESELGRSDGLIFSLSTQPPAVYAAKNRYEARVGHAVSWDAFYAANPDVNVQPQSSIFDPVLCEIVYRWFCPMHGVVLDPFAGGSVRAVVAAYLERRYAGCDLRDEQVQANRAQWAALAREGQAAPTWCCGDSRDLARHVGSVEADLVFSCPPYADLERYSDGPMDYPAFVTAYREIIGHACALLNPDRFACFVVGEIRDRKGHYRNFVNDTIAAFRDAGLAYYNEAILVTQAGSLPIRVSRSFPVSRKLGKSHQNVLVFVKGDPRAAAEACGAVDIAVPDDLLRDPQRVERTLPEPPAGATGFAMGFAAFEPTDEQRKLVGQLAAFGIPQPDMCALVLDGRGKAISDRTLRKYFARELAQGGVRANSRVAQSLLKKATGGDTIAAIFWLKCRARWKETAQAVELTGAEGGPLRYREMTDAELEAIVARARGRRSQRTAGPPKGPRGHS